MTSYSEVSTDDLNVVAFIVAHPECVNLMYTPVKLWAARDEETVVALLTLKTKPYLSLDLAVDTVRSPRAFMRIYKLYRLAETWLTAQGVPMIAFAIHDGLAHFQGLARRLGFRKIGTETDDDGNEVFTIFGKELAIQ